MMTSIRRRFPSTGGFGYQILLALLSFALIYYTNSRLLVASLHGPFHRPTPTINYQLKEERSGENNYHERLERYRKVCSARREPVQSYHYGYVYTNFSNNVSLSYCIVPKAGCTFWAKIFIFLNQTHAALGQESPFDINRFQVHNPKSIKHKLRRTLEGSVDFFFVRNPYSRLMSAYVDKIVLPQNLQEDMVGKLFGQQSTHRYQCFSELISFSDFIDMIVFGVGSNNPHWTPIHASCDPCKIRPSFIGKQETFLTDANYLLKSVGLDHLLIGYSTTLYDEITDLVDFVYNTYETNEHIQRCFTKTDITYRLWLAFQYKGYLPLQLDFPREEVDGLLNKIYNLTDATDVVSNYFLHTIDLQDIIVESEDELARQKWNNTVFLYASLSRASMEKIADLFDEDFKMYGYEKYPKEIFPWK